MTEKRRTEVKDLMLLVTMSSDEGLWVTVVGFWLKSVTPPTWLAAVTQTIKKEKRNGEYFKFGKRQLDLINRQNEYYCSNTETAGSIDTHIC